MDKNKVGVVLGLMGVLFHLGWSALVMSGFAQKLFDMVLWLHAISAPITIGPMDILQVIYLLAYVFVGWYVFGWLFACIWNAMNKK